MAFAGAFLDGPTRSSISSMDAGFLGGGAAAGGGVLVDMVERLLLALVLGADVRDELKELVLDELLELGALVEVLRVGVDSRDDALLEGRALLDVDLDALAELVVEALGSAARERASERASERALRSSDAACLASARRALRAQDDAARCASPRQPPLSRAACRRRRRDASATGGDAPRCCSPSMVALPRGPLWEWTSVLAPTRLAAVR